MAISILPAATCLGGSLGSAGAIILTFKSSSLKYPYLSANIIGAWSGLINQSKPNIIFFSELNEIEENNYGSEYEIAISENNDFTTIERTHDDLIMLMYTSGTTGHPKGAMITHRMQFFNIVNLASTARITDKAVQLVSLPLFHTGGMNCYANPVLHNGGQIILTKEFDPGKALEIINNPDYGVTHLFAVPAPYQFMMLHPDCE